MSTRLRLHFKKFYINYKYETKKGVNMEIVKNGEQFRKVREDFRLSQIELAKIFGLKSGVNISRIEANKANVQGYMDSLFYCMVEYPDLITKLLNRHVDK